MQPGIPETNPLKDPAILTKCQMNISDKNDEIDSLGESDEIEAHGNLFIFSH